MVLCGIYCYIDKLTKEVVYVGQDSNIHRNHRHLEHLRYSHYNRQHFNRVLQNNPNRYCYKILSVFNPNHKPQELLNALEISYIKFFGTFRPETGKGFNFNKGGGGSLGKKLSEETKQKISNTLTKNGKVKGENNPRYKNYARITKAGENSVGNDIFQIKRDGKRIKRSVDIGFLINWFTENYPNELLKIC